MAISPSQICDQTPGIAFFSGFNNTSSTTAIIIAAPLSTSQNVECFHSVQNTAIWVSLFPRPVATNQPPIIIPRKRVGATLETSESPIGESINSPSVSTPYAPSSHTGDTLNAYILSPVVVASPVFAAT